MGGFVDPFTPAPAWPHDLAFAGSSWSGSGASSLADSAELEFHLQNGSSSALMNGHAEETMSPLELHEPFLQEQLQGHLTHGLMNFEVDSAVERALMTGTLASILSTPCAPLLCSSNDSSGSEESSMLQSLLGEQQVQAPATWSSAFSQSSSLVGEEKSQGFGFGAVSNGDLLHEACTPAGKKYPQLGSVPSAPLQLHDDVKHNSGKMLSFAPRQQRNSNFDSLQIGQKELSGLHHLNLSSLVSGQLSAFNATGAALGPKQSNEARSAINGSTATSITRSVAPNGNAAGNGAPKPRVRARRGQATDPHSIAERQRREKISDRMKNLQELVPNSNKTDKASMLDEIIDYVKFLQLQVKVLSMSRLGATEAVVPLLTESQTESSGLLLSPKSGSGKAGGDMLEQSELRANGAEFEQEVAQLMENNMTTAMQYLQTKGLCLMPIALASAISDQKGTSSAAVRPENGGTAEDGGKGDVKKVPDVMKPFGSSKEMRSRA